jgi:PadR family transcriptional regulator, regulatory protein AphA
MSLRYALLSLLRVGPLSGYDLQKQFSLSVGHVWHAPDSQIYPELRKMEAAGLIEGEEQVRGERGTRRVYHVTDAGDRAFLEWMKTPLDYSRVRDPAHLRASYLEATTPDAAREFLRAHIAAWASELEQWEGELRRIDAVNNPMLVRRLAASPPEVHDRTIAFKRFAYEGLVDRARGEIEWARRGLDLVDELEASTGPWAAGTFASSLPRNVSTGTDGEAVGR